MSFCFSIMLFSANKCFYGKSNCFKNYGILSYGRYKIDYTNYIEG